MNIEQKAVELALGRIFRLMSRPTQAGDVEQYETARGVILECTAPVAVSYAPNYARDWNKGAQGAA